MNIYDKAHNLGKAIKDSNEYRNYYLNHDKINSNPKTKDIVRQFRKKAMEIQMIQMSGKKVDNIILNEMKQLEDTIIKNSIISEYFTSEMKFSQMMNDVYKILDDYIEIDIELDK